MISNGSVSGLKWKPTETDQYFKGPTSTKDRKNTDRSINSDALVHGLNRKLTKTDRYFKGPRPTENRKNTYRSIYIDTYIFISLYTTYTYKCEQIVL